MSSLIRSAALQSSRLAANRPRRPLLFVNGALLIAVLVAIISLRSETTNLRVGDVAGETIVAQHHVRYLDQLRTAQARARARAAVPTSHIFDSSVAQRHQRQAAAYLATVTRIVGQRGPLGPRIHLILEALPPGVKSGSLRKFLSLNPQGLAVVSRYTNQLLEHATSMRFDRSQVQTTAISLLSTIPPNVGLNQRTAIGELLATFLAPTYIPNLARTHRNRLAAASRTGKVMATISSGQVIVRRGDVVTAHQIEQLRALGQHGGHSGIRDVAATLLFTLAVVFILFWCFYAFYPETLANARLLLLVDGCLVTAVLAARLLTTGHVLLPFFLPVAGASTFAAVLVAPEASMAIALAMAVLSGWVVANSFELTMYYFLSGAAGVLAIRQATQLKRFAAAGIYIFAFCLLTSLSFGLVDQGYDFAAFQEYVLAAAFNGSVSATFALGGFAMLSGYFGVTTALQLLELARPNQPLLRRLTAKAPGTYNHSLIVSNMVEVAAEEIGANSLVAKVGALYHDVGKTANPHCFVENQMGMGNVHDDLRPDESARIIRGHVSQGLRLARQNRLPRVVLDAIGEHHGTMSLTFFLHKARQQSEEGRFNTSLYSYPGPKPQSRETALLMLADGCESAVRASHDHSQERIREVVETIFRERIEQGQLDECPLTIQDLELARRAFRSVLNGLYHPRIEYPDPVDPPISEPTPFPLADDRPLASGRG